MTLAIIAMTFSFCPFICLAGIALFLFPREVGLPEPGILAWHEEVPISPPQVGKELDSFSLLEEEIVRAGLEISGLASIPMTNDVIVFVEEEGTVDVDVSEFSDACNPFSVPRYPILIAEERVVETAPPVEKTVAIRNPRENSWGLVEKEEDELFLDFLLEETLGDLRRPLERALPPAEEFLFLSKYEEEEIGFLPTLVG